MGVRIKRYHQFRPSDLAKRLAFRKEKSKSEESSSAGLYVEQEIAENPFLPEKKLFVGHFIWPESLALKILKI